MRFLSMNFLPTFHGITMSLHFFSRNIAFQYLSKIRSILTFSTSCQTDNIQHQGHSFNFNKCHSNINFFYHLEYQFSFNLILSHSNVVFNFPGFRMSMLDQHNIPFQTFQIIINVVLVTSIR